MSLRDRRIMGLTPDSMFVRVMRRTRAYSVDPISYRLKYGALGKYLAYSRQITGFLSEQEGIELAQVCYALPPDAVVVEVGSFLGRSSVLFAGARKLRGSGKVHCIDPFDASGDSFSVPFYQRIAKRRRRSLREWFDENIRRAGVSSWVEVHQGTAQSIAPNWQTPIDMLILDGDQSPEGSRATYESFAPFLKPGGVLAVHNSAEREYDQGHDGHYRLVVETVQEPAYTSIYCIESTTFARKMQGSPVLANV